MPSGHIRRESPGPKLQLILTLYVEGWTWLKTFNLYFQQSYPFLVNVSSTKRHCFVEEPRINSDDTKWYEYMSPDWGDFSFTPWPALQQNDADITSDALQEDLEHSNTNIWEKCSFLKQTKKGRTMFYTRCVCACMCMYLKYKPHYYERPKIVQTKERKKKTFLLDWKKISVLKQLLSTGKQKFLKLYS